MLAPTAIDLPPARNGTCERALQAIRDARCRSPLDALDEHGELVAAEAGDGVAPAHALEQALADGGQELVAGLVAERVVDRLEPVEVDVEQRPPRRPPCAHG
jgi:hypothetical protein